MILLIWVSNQQSHAILLLFDACKKTVRMTPLQTSPNISA